MLEYLEVLSNLTGIDKTELEAKLTTDGPDSTKVLKPKKEIESTLTSLFGARLKSVGDDQRKRGKREALTDLEKDIKAKFNFQGDAMGVDLVEAVVNQAKAAKTDPSPKPKELTREEAEQLPVVKELLEEKVKALKEKATDFETKYTGLMQKQTISQKQNTLREILLKQKPVLPEDQEIADRQVNAFLKGINYDTLKLNEKGVLVPVDAEGNALQDEMYSPVGIDSWVRSQSFFAFHEIDPSKSSASPSSKKTTTSGSGGSGGDPKPEAPVFKSREEMMTWSNKQKDPALIEAAFEKNAELE